MSKLLVGFTAGLLVGLLFAPAKGSETRDSIARKGNELKDRFNDLVDSLSDKFNSLKDEAEDMAEEGKQKVRRAASTPTSSMG